jgi:hypothetical protein
MTPTPSEVLPVVPELQSDHRQQQLLQQLGTHNTNMICREMFVLNRKVGLRTQVNRPKLVLGPKEEVRGLLGLPVVTVGTEQWLILYTNRLSI